MLEWLGKRNSTEETEMPEKEKKNEMFDFKYYLHSKAANTGGLM